MWQKHILGHVLVCGRRGVNTSGLHRNTQLACLMDFSPATQTFSASSFQPTESLRSQLIHVAMPSSTVSLKVEHRSKMKARPSFGPQDAKLQVRSSSIIRAETTHGYQLHIMCRISSSIGVILYLGVVYF